MRIKQLQLMFAGLILCAATVMAVAQEKSKEEIKLETSAGALDKSAAMPEGQLRVAEKIKTEYGVDDARILGLRAQKMGYGEISIALGLAQGLPGGITDENVQKIMALRQGPPVMGWGKIAKDLGLKLGNVQSKVHKMAAEVRKQEKDKAKKDKKAEGEKGKKGEKTGKPEKPMKAEKPEHTGNSGKH